MSLVMQAKPKSAELILVFLILRVNISGKRTSQMVINVFAFGGIKMFFLKNHVEKVKIENIKSNEVYAPVEGEVIPLDEVDDAVFSEKILGDGVAVEPDKGEIYSPVKGTVSVVFPTKHVVGITTEEGANIILHIGIDTVELKGKGFDVKVEQGDKVEAGQLLMKINLPFIRKHHPATVMVILEKTDEFKVACTRDKQIRAGGRLLTLERII